MKVHHLNCGTWCPPSHRLFNGTGSLFAPGEVVCQCLLVETARGLVLVDTGLGEADQRDPAGRIGPLWTAVMRPRRDVNESAVRQVRRLGFDPHDVRDILVTHLDFDHAGGLPDFPWARVHVWMPEYEAAMRPTGHREQFRYKKAHWAHRPHWHFYEANGEHWFGFDSVQALGDAETDILLIPLAGHTRGHCGVAVRTPSGWLLLAGDAYFHHRQLAGHAAPPGLALYQGIMHLDKGGTRANLARLQALAQSHRQDVSVFCSHDPAEMAALLARAAPEIRRAA